MKKLLILLVIIFSATFLIISCSKDENDPEPVIPAPTIIASASSTSIDYNGTVTITWSSTNANQVTINDELVPLSGNKTYSSLKTNTTYNVVSTGNGKTATTQIVVTVAPEPIPVPTITIVQTSGSLPYADKGEFSWVTTGATTVSFGGVTYGTTGSFTTGELIVNTDFTLTVTGPGGSITQVVTFPVGDWTTSPLGLFTHSPWIQTKEEGLLLTDDYDTGIWTNFPLLHEIKKVFFIDRSQRTYVDGVLAGDEPYTFDGVNFQIGNGTSWVIKNLTQTELVMVAIVDGPIGPQAYYLRQTFKH